MAKSLSYQQLQILKILGRKDCYAYELKQFYSYSNLYTALKKLQLKGLIRKKGNKYSLTEKGYIVLKALW